MKIAVFPLVLAVTVIEHIGSLRCEAQTWEPPTHLNDQNTAVTFVVDSTWHTIHGTTRDLSGTVSLTNPKDPLSIRVDLEIPVKLFNTDNASRDEKLRTVMSSERYPNVSFSSSRLSPSCSPDYIRSAGRCHGTLSGALSIRDTTKTIELPIEITLEDAQFVARGTLPIQWGDFHVEDPSILIAKLDPTVTITYKTTIPTRQ
jgi:polyisoprenoid-binding protein YceI